VEAERDELIEALNSSKRAADKKFDNFAEHAYTTMCIALDDMVVQDRLAAHDEMLKFLEGCGYPGEAPTGQVKSDAWFADHYSFPDVAEDKDDHTEGIMDPGLSVGPMFQIAVSRDCSATSLLGFGVTQENFVKAIEELSKTDDPGIELKIYLSLMMVWSK